MGAPHIRLFAFFALQAPALLAERAASKRLERLPATARVALTLAALELAAYALFWPALDDAALARHCASALRADAAAAAGLLLRRAAAS